MADNAAPKRVGIAIPEDAASPGTAYRLHLERLFHAGRQGRFPGGTAEDLRRWQVETRLRLREILGVEMASSAEPPEIVQREMVAETEDYRQERIVYETLPGISVPAYLITPLQRTGPLPAVLCPPGHGSGIREVVDEEGAYKRYPLALARRGFVCLVPEHLGFGHRADDARGCSHAYYYTALLLLGKNAMGVLLSDLLQGLDLLAAQPGVDAARLGCWGLSLGGEMTLLLSALDLRVRAAAISGFLSSYESTFLNALHCGCGYVPGLARYLEHADIAALIAPRPLWVEIGLQDTSFPYTTTETAVAELRAVYEIAGAAGALRYHAFPGGHEVSGAPVVDWFAQTLAGAH